MALVVKIRVRKIAETVAALRRLGRVRREVEQEARAMKARIQIELARGR